jgi:uncharacterized protein
MSQSAMKRRLAKVREYVLGRMRDGCGPGLPYHNLWHTWHDVLPAARRLARMEGLPEEAQELLLASAWLHDIGYLEQYPNNEPIAARMAAATLPGFGYSAQQTQKVVRIILATQLPQKPKSILQQILCDADLDSLGRKNFLKLSHDLHREICMLVRSIPITEWYSMQLTFLQSHRYFTRSAKALRNEGKRRNIEKLKRLLRSTRTE